MKGLLHPVAITFYVVIFIILLPFILPDKSTKVYTDEALREAALSRNMLPIPKDYDALLKVVDTPENPMSREKIALGKKLFFDTLLSQDKTISCASCHMLPGNGANSTAYSFGVNAAEGNITASDVTILGANFAHIEVDYGSNGLFYRLAKSTTHDSNNSTIAGLVKGLLTQSKII